MAASKPSIGGVIGALRRMAYSLGALAQTRFELFVVELQEERLRTVSLLIWIGAGLALGLAGILVSLGALAFYLWEIAGYSGLVGLSAATLTASAGVFAFVWNRIRHGPLPFAETSAEFRKDLESLRLPE